MKDQGARPDDYAYTAESCDGSNHCIAITKDGSVFTWGSKNKTGCLGRRGKMRLPGRVALPEKAKTTYVGGLSDSGHTVVIDEKSQMWVWGCDRWQQLGLGSPGMGAGGYTWSSILQSTPVLNTFVPDLLRTFDDSATIRDVAIGGDHTVILSSNRSDVIVCGKGGEGQLGLNERRFVSAPVRSSKLSKSNLAAVCAIEHCSLTLDDRGDVQNTAGKCTMSSSSFRDALHACQMRARKLGLLANNKDAAERATIESKPK